MVPSIARHLIEPLHERLLGRPTFRYLRELEESQWFSPADLRDLQRTKLAALLRHADAHTAFYRHRFREAGIDLDDRDALASLRRLPLLEKSTIRRSSDEMVWHAAPGGVFEYHTGGSTGEPLTFYFDRRRQGYDQAARIRTHRWFGVDVGDRELYLWGSPVEHDRTDRLKRLRDTLVNQRLLNAFNMSPDRMDAYLDLMNRFRPSCLFGYPSSVALLIDHARSRKRSIDTRNLKAVFVTGEVCYAHDRQAISAYLNVPIADCYGSREAGFIAHQCPEGNMHLTAENVIVEIIRDGRPVPIGEEGEIVVTHLDVYAMPFIRYRTGDLGRLKVGRCRCGRGLPMMDVVAGRTTDFLYFPDGAIKHALSIVYPLRTMNGVRRFRVSQDADYSVAIDIVRDEGASGVTKAAVARAVRPVLNGQIAVNVRLVDHLVTDDSGKFRYVVSRAKPAKATDKEEPGGVPIVCDV